MLINTPKLPPIGCNGRGIQDSSLTHPVSLKDPPIAEQFRLLKRAGVFDYLDKLPSQDDVPEYLALSNAYALPLHTTHWFYEPGRHADLLTENLARSVAFGATTHNVMLFSRHADGHFLNADEVADLYLHFYDEGMKFGIEPSFETHINCWSEDPRLVTPVAERVQRRGVPFNLTLDYSHCIFKIGNERELRTSNIFEDVQAGRVILDPLEPGNFVDQWLEQGIVRWYQMRSSVPNGPRNIWAPHDPDVQIGAVPNPAIFEMQPGDPGRGILYPFAKPAPGEWHSEWHSYLLEPARTVARKVLTHHARNPQSRLRYITTEMITNPDYGMNAKFSLIAQNAAIARFIRSEWAAISGSQVST